MAARTQPKKDRKRGQALQQLPEEVVRNLLSRYLDRNKELYREELAEAISMPLLRHTAA